jgi:hypothetical protein
MGIIMIFNTPIVLNAKMADEKLEKVNEVKEFKDCISSNKIKNMRIKLNFFKDVWHFSSTSRGIHRIGLLVVFFLFPLAIFNAYFKLCWIIITIIVSFIDLIIFFTRCYKKIF